MASSIGSAWLPKLPLRTYSVIPVARKVWLPILVATKAAAARMRLNADDHDLMKHMHRPDPKRVPEMQDKRMVVILPEGLYDAWLDAPASESKDFMRQYPADRLPATGYRRRQSYRRRKRARRPCCSKGTAAVTELLLQRVLDRDLLSNG